MTCCDLDSVVALGLSIYGILNDITAEFNQYRNARGLGFDETSARTIAELYKDWCEPSRGVSTAIREFETAGYTVKRADDFREACENAFIPAYHFDRIVDSMNQFSRRGGTPMGEAFAAIRNKAAR